MRISDWSSDVCSSDLGAIVVCALKPESERYRIPKELRKKKEVAGSQGWGSRVETMESVNRQLLPNSCSAIGSNGQTGCTQAMLRKWFAERSEERRVGKECVSTCSSRRSPHHKQNKNRLQTSDNKQTQP